MLVIVLLLVIVAEFINGCTDAPNVIATAVSTKALGRGPALTIAVVGNVLGILLFGTHVAKTIGSDVVNNHLITLNTLCAALLAGAVWGTFAWIKAYGISKTHTLYAGLLGAALAKAGTSGIVESGWIKLGVGLLVSIGVGTILGALLVWVLESILTRKAQDSRFFRVLQIFTAGGVALAHGSNDGQKYVGVFAQALLLGGITQTFSIPAWVILVCCVIMGIGTACGGWNIVERIESEFKIKYPYQGATIESCTAFLLICASLYGVPQSTTHTMNSACIGVGAASKRENISKSFSAKLYTMWAATFPACILLGYVFSKVIDFLVR